MFDILKANIIIFQETKNLGKDLRDDMVLVLGWDCYWSLPRHKKGARVKVYHLDEMLTPRRLFRSRYLYKTISLCSYPCRGGVTGILCPPNSSTSFSEPPEAQKSGGYPTLTRPASSSLDAATIGSEGPCGMCVILEFPTFVLLGVYSPAERDESKDDFRLSFLNLLDVRTRNLTSLGKRFSLTGDMNISPEEIDTLNTECVEEYMSMPSRQLLISASKEEMFWVKETRKGENQRCGISVGPRIRIGKACSHVGSRRPTQGLETVALGSIMFFAVLQ
ncbi:Class II abasic (AP) endonuclease [Sticta canariensis]|nr:Class II abasic (AP) endonuclease [Sticta canariensis]